VDHAQAWDTSPHSQSSAELLDKHLDCAYWYGTIRTPFRDLNDLEGKLLMTEFHIIDPELTVSTSAKLLNSDPKTMSRKRSKYIGQSERCY